MAGEGRQGAHLCQVDCVDVRDLYTLVVHHQREGLGSRNTFYREFTIVTLTEGQVFFLLITMSLKFYTLPGIKYFFLLGADSSHCSVLTYHWALYQRQATLTTSVGAGMWGLGSQPCMA